MKRTVRKNHRRSFFGTYLLLSSLAFCLAFIGTKIFFPTPITLHTLAFLKVPSETPTVYLPGPYEAAHIESPVLGAETINPSDIVLF
ncbi:MAG: hypothetical protein NT149_04520, partial [Candidatus Gottesmanbacteria bacterium]|nr:hypothetical protein [Candidatus Gottesmanbacteria bacterium]